MEFFVLATWREAVDKSAAAILMLYQATNEKGAARRLLITLPDQKKYLARVERLGQPETKTAFGNESHFFFSSGVSSICASGCTHC